MTSTNTLGGLRECVIRPLPVTCQDVCDRTDTRISTGGNFQ